MVPLYAILAAPLTKPRARAAASLVHALEAEPRRSCSPSGSRPRSSASTARSFPLDSAKVVAIGHGIDTDRFACAPSASRASRCARSRSGAPRRRRDSRRSRAPRRSPASSSSLRGPSLDRRGARRAAAARARSASALERAAAARRGPGAPRRGKDVLVNNMREGALDKVVYEAAATCMPVLASNTGFDDLLPPELRFHARRPRRPRREAARARRRRPRTRSAASCARGSRRATRSSTGPTRCSRWRER